MPTTAVPRPTERSVRTGLAVLALTLLGVLLVPPVASAGRGPVYRDPPSYEGIRRAPPTRAPQTPPAPVVTLSASGTFPDVLVDEAGTAHIVWNEDRGDDADAARYCRLKRGATACDTTATLTWEKAYGPGDSPAFNVDNLGPRIVRVGDQLVVLSKRYPTVADKPDGGSSSTVLMWTSADGGTTWAGPAIVGKWNLGELVTIGPPDDPTIVNLGVDPLCDAPGPAGLCVQAYRSGVYSPAAGNLSSAPDENYDATLALDRGVPVMAATDLAGNAYVRRWSGAGSVLDPGTWSAPTVFRARETDLAGGPAGAFLLSRPDFGQRFDVRALTVRPDGTMGSGRATPLSTGRDPVFGELAQDPSGRLHAVWQERDPAAAGVRLRTGTAGGSGGPSFGPEQTLLPGADAGQFSLAAAADGGGFVALNRTGGVNSPGQIQAVGFGTLRATNAPGLGGLEGGSGGGAVTRCQRVEFGAFDIEATAGCFLNGTGANRRVVVTPGEVRIQGLRIVPDAGARLVIDPRTLRLDTVGGDARVIVTGPGVGDIVLWHGQIHRDLSRVRPGTTLFEFPAGAFAADVLGFRVATNIPIRLERDGLRIPIELRLPPAFGGFTGKATLRVDRTSGLRIDSLRIRIGPVPLGALVINEIDLSYTGAGEAWTGKGSVTVPAGGKLDASVSFEGGDFAGARMGFTPATPIPLGPFVYLLSVDGGFDVSPVFIEAGARIGAGAAVQGTAPVNVDGRFEMRFPPSGPATFRMNGRVNVFMFNIADGFLRFMTDGYADFGGHVGLSLGPLTVDANMDGFVDATRGDFGSSLDGKVELCIDVGVAKPCASAGADAALSKAGFAACARLDLPAPAPDATGGIKYPWSKFNPLVLANPVLLTASLIDSIRIPCSTDDFRVAPPRPRAAQAGGGTAVAVAGGLPSATLLVEGVGGAPRVSVSGPGGASFSSSAPSAAGFVATVPGIDAAYVVLHEPAGGDWTVTPEPGSVPIAQVRIGEGFEPARVTARLGGRGRARTISYAISGLGHGQRVTFVEEGAFGTRIIGSTSRARGTLRFRPAEARGGRRSVLALVEHRGLVTDRTTVGRYTAPGPRRPGAVRRLRARRSGTAVTVTWRRAPGAARYVVRLRGRRGTGAARLVRGGARRVRFTAVRRDDRVTVEVRALSRSLRAGPARRVRLRPGR